MEAAALTSAQPGQPQRMTSRGKLDAAMTNKTDSSEKKAADKRPTTSLTKQKRWSWRRGGGATSLMRAILAVSQQNPRMTYPQRPKPTHEMPPSVRMDRITCVPGNVARIPHAIIGRLNLHHDILGLRLLWNPIPIQRQRASRRNRRHSRHLLLPSRRCRSRSLTRARRSRSHRTSSYADEVPKDRERSDPPAWQRPPPWTHPWRSGHADPKRRSCGATAHRRRRRP
jgi:hypothetical protein